MISVPENFDVDSFKEFLNEFLPVYKSSKKVTLDFSSCRLPDIDALILLLMYEDISKAEEKVIEYYSPKSEKPSGLDNMLSLFKRGHGPFSTESFEVFSAKRNLPLTRVKGLAELRDAVNKLDLIIQHQFQATRDVAMALSWCLGELTDNSVTHGYQAYDSDSDLPAPIYMAAWSLNDCVEIVIADRGIGIIDSLRKKPAYVNRQRSDVLKASLEKGVSGHPIFSPGFGLYSVSEIVRQSNSKMTIITNGISLKQAGGTITTSSVSAFPGVFMSIEIKKNAPVSLQDIIGRASVENMAFLLGEP